MIYASGLNYGEKQEEMLEMDQMKYPYACYYRTMDTRFQSTVSWHWHKSIEIDYIMEGELVLTTPDQELTLRKGDICFINSGVLHSFSTGPQSDGCSFYAHLFRTSFLSGMHNSQIEQKYILPILGNRAVTVCHFPEGTPSNTAMTPIYLHIVELDLEQPFGYEFAVREELSRLWCMFFQETRSLHGGVRQKESADSRRVREMLQYIHEHYAEPVSLGDIAGAVGVSRQECMRCFRKYLRVSPISYLSEYRVRIAAGQLLHTDQSIITISENCGFSSNSYFSKVFHQTMGCTPKEYRQIQQESPHTQAVVSTTSQDV